MNSEPKNTRGWRVVRRILIGLAVVATLVAIFYTEEDWRGKRAWEKTKHQLEARGVVWDWNKYIPPPVPDDQNFFTASSNILLRFKKAQTDAEREQAEKNLWLRLGPSDSNAFPILDTSKVGPLLVARVVLLPPDAANAGQGGGDLTVTPGDLAATAQAGDLLSKTIGRSVNGAQGFKFSERSLDHIQPAKIIVRTDRPFSTDDLAKLIPLDIVTNIGHLQVAATAEKTVFEIRLAGVHITAAADYLKWSGQYVPAFGEIREALKRPDAILPGDYSHPYLIPIPNFITLRAVAQTLAQRAQCDFLLGKPEQALDEVRLMHDICKILEKPPTGAPKTLVEAMIHVAIMGLYISVVSEGLQMNAWQEPQLAALQSQLQDTDLLPPVASAFHFEQIATAYTFETTRPSELVGLFSGPLPDKKKSFADRFRHFKSPLYLFMEFGPRGWIYQNMVTGVRLTEMELDGVDVSAGTISPVGMNAALEETDRTFQHWSPNNYLASIATPNFVKAWRTTAHNQASIAEGEVACALERYQLAHGEYPEALDALVPQFIEKLPHDIIGGGPLHYQRTAQGKFLLYSIGWNEKDDGGVDSSQVNNASQYAEGDWVWKN